MIPEREYLDELTARLRRALDLRGVYLIGSAALGGYRPGKSDLDVLAVSATPVTAGQRAAVVATCRHEALPCPARKLELVVYAPDGETVELNLNTGRDETETPDVDGFWFVLDRAIAHRYAHPLLGPPPQQAIAAPADDAVDRALDEQVAWYEANEPGEPARIAAARARAYRETGTWARKTDR